MKHQRLAHAHPMRYLMRPLTACAFALATGFAASPSPALAASPFVYVEPAGTPPGPEFVWRLHPEFGWGWYSPRAGWHAGWRAAPEVVYVAPPGVAPAPGFVWSYHPRHGWGWYHPHHGWHAGW